MAQENLVEFAVLSNENELARNTNFDDAKDSFAAMTAKKGVFL